MTQEYEDTQRIERRVQSPQSWHLKKEVSVGLVVAMVFHVVVVVMYITRIEGRVDVIQADTVFLHQTDSRMTSDIQTSVSVLREDIKDLRRLVESQQHNK